MSISGLQRAALVAMPNSPVSMETFARLQGDDLNPVASRFLGPVTSLGMALFGVGETVTRLFYIPIKFVATLINLQPREAFVGVGRDLIEVGRSALRVAFFAAGVFITIIAPKTFFRSLSPSDQPSPRRGLGVDASTDGAELRERVVEVLPAADREAMAGLREDLARERAALAGRGAEVARLQTTLAAAEQGRADAIAAYNTEMEPLAREAHALRAEVARLREAESASVEAAVQVDDVASGTLTISRERLSAMQDRLTSLVDLAEDVEAPNIEVVRALAAVEKLREAVRVREEADAVRALEVQTLLTRLQLEASNAAEATQEVARLREAMQLVAERTRHFSERSLVDFGARETIFQEEDGARRELEWSERLDRVMMRIHSDYAAREAAREVAEYLRARSLVEFREFEAIVNHYQWVRRELEWSEGWDRTVIASQRFLVERDMAARALAGPAVADTVRTSLTSATGEREDPAAVARSTVESLMIGAVSQLETEEVYNKVKILLEMGKLATEAGTALLFHPHTARNLRLWDCKKVETCSEAARSLYDKLSACYPSANQALQDLVNRLDSLKTTSLRELAEEKRRLEAKIAADQADVVAVLEAIPDAEPSTT